MAGGKEGRFSWRFRFVARLAGGDVRSGKQFGSSQTAVSLCISSAALEYTVRALGILREEALSRNVTFILFYFQILFFYLFLVFVTQTFLVQPEPFFLVVVLTAMLFSSGSSQECCCDTLKHVAATIIFTRTKSKLGTHLIMKKTTGQKQKTT